MIKAAIDKIKEIGYDRCGNCPAYWTSVDYWGEGDAGCLLHRDTEEFCALSFAPKVVMKSLIKKDEKRMDKHYAELDDQMAQHEFELGVMHEALVKTLAETQYEFCFNGKPVNPMELYYPFANELLREYKAEIAKRK